MTATYLIALGSNRSSRHGSPAAAIAAVLAAVGGARAVSRTIQTAPIGPSQRRFANAAALIESAESPPELLARLKAIERDFGRRGGQRWGARPIDLDIILWSGGSWGERRLIVPHPRFRERAFVLRPAAAIAPHWRDPVTGRTLRQLAHMVDRRRPRA